MADPTSTARIPLEQAQPTHVGEMRVFHGVEAHGDLGEFAPLDNSRFVDCDFSGATFPKGLSNVEFVDCDLREVTFTDTHDIKISGTHRISLQMHEAGPDVTATNLDTIVARVDRLHLAGNNVGFSLRRVANAPEAGITIEGTFDAGQLSRSYLPDADVNINGEDVAFDNNAMPRLKLNAN